VQPSGSPVNDGRSHPPGPSHFSAFQVGTEASAEIGHKGRPDLPRPQRCLATVDQMIITAVGWSRHARRTRTTEQDRGATRHAVDPRGLPRVRLQAWPLEGVAARPRRPTSRGALLPGSKGPRCIDRLTELQVRCGMLPLVRRVLGAPAAAPSSSRPPHTSAGRRSWTPLRASSTKSWRSPWR